MEKKQEETFGTGSGRDVQTCSGGEIDLVCSLLFVLLPL